MQEFNNRNAVITGAASGIGLAMSELFADQGMNIVMVDIEQAALDAVAERVKAKGVEVLLRVCDVGSAAAMQTLADDVTAQLGNVHLLCNNAGVFVGGASWENSAADYEWLFRVNVLGVANGLRAFVPGMIAHGEEAHIVTTASMAALTTMPFSSVYCTSKAAALSLTECLHKELESTAPQIGVSVLCPELINTGIAAAGRNRPAEFSGEGDIVETDFSKMTSDAITESTASGLEPIVMAQRVLDGVRARKFYLLAEDYWKAICNHRLDEIRSESNPTLFFPES